MYRKSDALPLNSKPTSDTSGRLLNKFVGGWDLLSEKVLHPLRAFLLRAFLLPILDWDADASPESLRAGKEPGFAWVDTGFRG